MSSPDHNITKTAMFTRTISIGNIIQLIVIIVGVSAFAFRIEGRVDVVESNLNNLEKRFEDSRSDIKSRLNRIEDKLDRALSGNVSR